MHISTARKILNAHEPLKISFVTAKGELQTYSGAIPLQADFYAGTRNLKLPNGEIRRIRDTLIVAINDDEVYL